MLQVGERLGRYEVEKRCAVEKEDYDLAKEKKQQMEQFRNQVYEQLQLHSLVDAEPVGAWAAVPRAKEIQPRGPCVLIMYVTCTWLHNTQVTVQTGDVSSRGAAGHPLARRLMAEEKGDELESGISPLLPGSASSFVK